MSELATKSRAFRIKDGGRTARKLYSHPNLNLMGDMRELTRGTNRGSLVDRRNKVKARLG